MSSHWERNIHWRRQSSCECFQISHRAARSTMLEPCTTISLPLPFPTHKKIYNRSWICYSRCLEYVCLLWLSIFVSLTSDFLHFQNYFFPTIPSCSRSEPTDAANASATILHSPVFVFSSASSYPNAHPLPLPVHRFVPELKRPQCEMFTTRFSVLIQLSFFSSNSHILFFSKLLSAISSFFVL